MTVEWKKQIAIAYLVKQRIAELDKDHLWELHYPEIAATEDQIRAAESHLGFTLPVQYRQFLGCANGWQCFYLNIDLFGVEDLLGSERMRKALEVLEWLEADAAVGASLPKGLLPIGVSREDNNVFSLTTSPHPHPGQVLWYSGRLIQAFPDFKEFFLAMCDYSRLEVERLLRVTSRDLSS